MVPGQTGAPAVDRSAAKIVDAAVTLMIEKNSQNISMIDVSRAAGISRTTLYRHFPTREALLEGVFDLSLRTFEERMNAAIAARPAVEARIIVLAEFFEEELLGERLLRMYRADAGLMLRLTYRVLEQALGMFLGAMAPIFDMADALSGERVDRDRVAQFFVRFSASLVLLPDPEMRYRPAELLATLIRALLKPR